jgi:hypothetical protein
MKHFINCESILNRVAASFTGDRLRVGDVCAIRVKASDRRPRHLSCLICHFLNTINFAALESLAFAWVCYVFFKSYGTV